MKTYHFKVLLTKEAYRVTREALHTELEIKEHLLARIKSKKIKQTLEEETKALVQAIIAVENAEHILGE